MGLRFYRINEDLYPSVTTVIDHSERKSLASLHRRAIEYDLENGEGAWEKKRVIASERGMIIHTLVQETLAGFNSGSSDWLFKDDEELLSLGVIEEALPFWASVKPHLISLLEQYPNLEVVWSELPVFNPDPHSRYCGRPDLVINLNDSTEGMRLMLIDIKTYGGYQNKWHGVVNQWKVWRTSKKEIRPERPSYDWLTDRPKKAFQQLYLYASALEGMSQYDNLFPSIPDLEGSNSSMNNSLLSIGEYKLDDISLWVINPNQVQVIPFWSNRGGDKDSFHWLWDEVKEKAEGACNKFWYWYDKLSPEEKALAEIIEVDTSYLNEDISSQSDLIPF